jgi:transcriptional regulator with XRE-family HTH domain
MLSTSNLEQWLSQPDEVAARLRALRAQAGQSGKELAESLGWQPSKVSRLETAGRPHGTDLDACALAACGADAPEVSDLQRLLDGAQAARMAPPHSPGPDRGASRRQRPHRAIGDDSLLRDRVHPRVHLQTPAYARCILAEMVDLHDLAVDEVGAAAAALMQCQHALYEPGKRFDFVLAEPSCIGESAPPTSCADSSTACRQSSACRMFAWKSKVSKLHLPGSSPGTVNGCVAACVPTLGRAASRIRAAKGSSV